MKLRKATGSENQTNNRRGRILRIAIPVCILLLLTVMVAAKFIHTTQKDDSITAEDFYFTSDLLDGQTHTIAATDGGTAKLVFTLQNHADELRFSKTDITYTVTAKDNANDSALTLTDSNSSNASGTIAAGAVNDTQVIITGLKAGHTYVITAVTNNTYKKNLTGTIQVKAADEAVYSSVRDGGAYIEVSVWTADYSGEVKLSYRAGLIPDNTNPLLTSAKTASSATEISLGNMEAGTSHVLRFFKPDSSKTYNSNTNGKKVEVNEQ